MALPTIDIRIAIVAHIARLQHATNLAEQTQANYITVDDSTLGCTKNHIQAWTYHTQQNSQWALVIEDDALPIPNFREQLEKALLTAPTPLVSLYLGQGRPHFQTEINQAITNATNTDAHYITGPNCLHAVAIALQTQHTPSLLQHLQTPSYDPIDNRITTWATQHQLQTTYTYPSLVDHNDTLPVQAIHDGGRQPGRIAHTIGTRPQWENRSVQL